ncbi:MAG: hypothetical protein HUJ70_14685 [Pseudobutyrivibrio sp.]|nr:hypothetical protein [Pseudobutyrivibrio sp.]MCF0186191.1 hypothetical protein [Bacteroidaceae bacterium]
MSKIKIFLTSTAGIATSFVLAAGLLMFGSVGGARAALTYYSESYQSQVEMKDIGVSLVENGTVVSTRDYYYTVADGTWKENTGVLLGGLSLKDDKIEFEKPYQEELSVKNTGRIPIYARVTVYKYWVKPNGDKCYDIHPGLISLTFNENSNWEIDTAASTDERTVYYYKKILQPDETTAPLTKNLRISMDKNAKIKTEISYDEEGYKHIDKYYDLNDYRFILQADVDAVQTHNAADAILSAWGKSVTISGDTLSIK